MTFAVNLVSINGGDRPERLLESLSRAFRLAGLSSLTQHRFYIFPSGSADRYSGWCQPKGTTGRRGRFLWGSGFQAHLLNAPKEVIGGRKRRERDGGVISESGDRPEAEVGSSDDAQSHLWTTTSQVIHAVNNKATSDEKLGGTGLNMMEPSSLLGGSNILPWWNPNAYMTELMSSQDANGHANTVWKVPHAHMPDRSPPSLPLWCPSCLDHKSPSDFVISLCCTAILISLPAIAALSSLLFLKFYHIPQTLTSLVGCCRVRGPNPPVNSLSPLPVLSAWQGLEPQSTLYTQVWLPLDIRDEIKIVPSNIIR